MYVHEGEWPSAVVVVYALALVTTSAVTGTIASPQGRAEKGAASRGDGASVRLAAVGRLEGGEGTSELCDSARLQCTVRTGCYMALQNFFIGCNSIITGEEGRCTTACKHALVSLLATEDEAGLAFINCNCSGHQMCEERKQRVQVCQRHVLDSMDLVRDDSATVSCSFARWICEADTSCLAALQYYVLHCAKLFQGTKCSARCRNSVHILYRQPNARKLRTCRCEGTEDYDCPKLVANTEKLCFQRHRHGHQLHQHLHNHHNSSTEYLYDDDDDKHTGVSPATLDSQRQPSSVTSLHSKRSGNSTPEVASRRRKRRNKPRKRNKKRRKKPASSFPWNTMFKDQQKTKRMLKRRSRSRGRRQRRRLCGGGGGGAAGGRGQRRARREVVVVVDEDRGKDKGKESHSAATERRKCLVRVRKGVDSKRAKKKSRTSTRRRTAVAEISVTD